MNKNIRMPFRPKVINDESLNSYINRLAQVNYHEIAWLNELLKIKVNEDQSCQEYRIGKRTIDTSILSTITGINQKELDNLSLNLKSSDQVIQKKLNRYAIRNTMKAICPLCLNDKLYYRKIWDISIYTRCHIHNCLLLCSCKNCGRRITIKEVIIDLCKCGCKLSSNLTVKCENSDLGYLLSQKIENKYSVRKSIYKKFNILELDLLIYLILFLSFNISRIFYQRTIAFSESSDFIFCDRVVDEAYNIFTNWPLSFYQFLDKIILIPQNNRSGGVNVHFGGFHQQINKLSLISDFRFFTDEYKNYIQNIWSDKHSKKALFVEYINISQACIILGVSKGSITTLIREGLIEAKTAYWWKQKIILINRLSLENYKNYLEISYKKNSNKIYNDIAKKKGYITVGEAAARLGTSRTSVTKLVKDHSIRPGRAILIQEFFVDMLADLIKKSEMFSDELELFNFYYAQRYFIRTTKRTVKDFYEFLFETEIQFFIKPNRIGFERIYFNKTKFVQKLMSFENKIV